MRIHTKIELETHVLKQMSKSYLFSLRDLADSRVFQLVDYWITWYSKPSCTSVPAWSVVSAITCNYQNCWMWYFVSKMVSTAEKVRAEDKFSKTAVGKEEVWKKQIVASDYRVKNSKRSSGGQSLYCRLAGNYCTSSIEVELSCCNVARPRIPHRLRTTSRHVVALENRTKPCRAMLNIVSAWNCLNAERISEGSRQRQTTLAWMSKRRY